MKKNSALFIGLACTAIPLYAPKKTPSLLEQRKSSGGLKIEKRSFKKRLHAQYQDERRAKEERAQRVQKIRKQFEQFKQRKKKSLNA